MNKTAAHNKQRNIKSNIKTYKDEQVTRLCTVLPDRPLLPCVNRGFKKKAAFSAARDEVRGDLVVDTFYTDLGQRSFSVAAPEAWNELPD